jgi:ferrous iron transport protein A
MILDSSVLELLISLFLYYFMTSISELEQGDVVRLVGFGLTEASYRRRLLSLGITRGVEFLIIRKAPLGCPMQIEVRGTFITLRKEEANHLILERV